MAVNASGQKEAGMGVAAGDFDRDGDFDLVLTHLTGESHTLYVNRGDGFFDDRTRSSLLDVLGLDYVRTARAKGLNERLVVVRHGLRNAMLPERV